MRGAVLSALGLQVQEHVMRRHYGVVVSRPWEPDDPFELHFINLEGESMCGRTFKWYAHMVMVHLAAILINVGQNHLIWP